MSTIAIYPSKVELIEQAKTRIIDAVQSAVSDRGICTVALSGGSTPKPLYAALAETDLPWEKLHCFWGDERYVPADHPDSNLAMAQQAWLNRVPIPPANIHGMPTSAGDPATDAATYQAHLQDFFQLQPPVFPRFDVVLLGLGDDGHTASLFPHTAALGVSDRWITVGQKGNDPRLTFTIPLINQARQVIFLVAGANKQTALDAIFREDGDEALDRQYPARFIRPQPGSLLWMLDTEAGQNLKA